MTTQPPTGPPAAPLGPPTGPNRPDADWSSPLWGRPDTVASGWAPAPSEQAPTVVPIESARRSQRAVLAGATALLLVLALVGGVLVHSALGRDTKDTAAALPTPSARTPADPTPDPTQSQPAQQDPGTGQNPAAPVTPGTGSEDLTSAQQAAVTAVSPGLVDIVSTIGYDGAQGAGTGVVLTSDGLVLTNHHVVAGSTSLKVTDIGNGKTYTATVLGYDASHDIAVIKLADASGLTTAPLGDSSTVALRDAVVALGNALGKGGAPSPVAGTVTALDQAITAMDSSNGTSEQLSGLIQIDAHIQPGDSGGALIDKNAQVVGIITAASVSNDRQTTTATEGYAVPLATAKQIADQIIAGQSSATVHIGGSAFLGVQIAGDSAGTTDGVVIAGTVSGSAADRAGITAGDAITEVDGKKVTTGAALRAALGSHHPGDRVSVHWVDTSGTSHSATVTLKDGPTG